MMREGVSCGGVSLYICVPWRGVDCCRFSLLATQGRWDSVSVSLSVTGGCCSRSSVLRGYAWLWSREPGLESQLCLFLALPVCSHLTCPSLSVLICVVARWEGGGMPGGLHEIVYVRHLGHRPALGKHSVSADAPVLAEVVCDHPPGCVDLRVFCVCLLDTFCVSLCL